MTPEVPAGSASGAAPAAGPVASAPVAVDPPMVEPEPPVAVEVFGDGIVTARVYVQLLATDGVIRGLIGPRETGRLWSRHLLNCAALGELLPRDAGVVDVGSGAGLPGLVLAIARPDCRVALLEPLDRRVRFLLEAVDRLDLTNCLVVRSRAQDAPSDVRGADVVVSRAVAPLGRLAGWCAGLARPGGTFLALKGSTAQEELRRDEGALLAAGLRDPAVVRLAGPAGETFVVRATRSADRPGRSGRPDRSRPLGAADRRTDGRTRRST